MLSYVFAGNQYELYQYLDWIAKQAVPITSSDESLLAWAALKGLSLKEASPSIGQVQFSGVAGSVIPDGTVLVRPDGYLYAIPINAGGTIGASGTVTLTAQSLTSGVSSNIVQADPTARLSLQTPIAGVNNTVTIVSDFTGGADVESQASLRSRLVEVFSNPIQGGDLQDYVTWALQVPGVTRAWSAGPSVMGAGTVTIYWCQDDNSHIKGLPHGNAGGSQYESRIPPASQDALILADYIYPLRAATAIIWCIPPVGDLIDITLGGVPVDTTIRNNISDALASFCIRSATPGGVLLPDNTPGGWIRVSQLEAAISAIPGLTYFDLVTLNGSTPADFQSAQGHIAIPGTITYLP